jgi:hypothetical protein
MFVKLREAVPAMPWHLGPLISSSILLACDAGSDATLLVDRLAVGQSNPTYRLTSGSQRYALRPRQFLNSAHTIDREFPVTRLETPRYTCLVFPSPQARPGRTAPSDGSCDSLSRLVLPISLELKENRSSQPVAPGIRKGELPPLSPNVARISRYGRLYFDFNSGHSLRAAGNASAPGILSRIS